MTPTTFGASHGAQLAISGAKLEDEDDEVAVTQALDLRLRNTSVTNNPASNLDNLYTPENAHFYAKARYLALDAKRREIRLLRVFPQKAIRKHLSGKPQWVSTDRPGARETSWDDFEEYFEIHGKPPRRSVGDFSTMIACELIEKIPLSKVDGKYCTLSYCAGDPRNTRQMVIDGQIFNAFANLEHAIESALACWTSRYPGKDLLLWADQICINQQDLAERASQVSMMRDIYRRSNETYICLSNPKSTDYLAWFYSTALESLGIEVEHDPFETSSSKSLSSSQIAVRRDMSLKTDVGRKPAPETLDSQSSLTTRKASKSSDIPFLLSPRNSTRVTHPCSSEPSLLNELPNNKSSTEAAATRHSPIGIWKASLRKKLLSETESVAVTLDAWLKGLALFTESAWLRRAWVYVSCFPLRHVLEEDGVDASVTSPSQFSFSWGRCLHFQVANSTSISYQEFIASPRPHFMSGNSLVPWSELFPIVDFVCHHFGALLESIEADLVEEASRIRENFQNEMHELETRMKQYKQEVKDYEDLQKKEWQTEQQEKRQIVKQASRQAALDVANRVKERETIQTKILKLQKEADAIKKDKKLVRSLDFVTRLRCTHRIQRLEREQEILSQTVEQKERLHHQHTSEIQSVESQDPSFTSDDWKQFRASVPRPISPLPSTSDSPWDNYMKQWQRKSEAITSLQQRLRAIDLSTIASVTRVKTQAPRLGDLKTHLRHSRKCMASDPRDRCYAFLGLAQPGYSIVPDYSTGNTVVHVLINTAKMIVEHEKSLRILEHVGHGRDKLGFFLPTWIPDWTSPESEPGVMEYVSPTGALTADFDASKGTSTAPEFRTDAANETNVDMKVKGVLVDFLENPQAPMEAFKDFQMFLTTKGEQVVTPKSALPDDQVWILHGAPKPVVLRSEGDDKFGFLGEGLILKENGSFSELMSGQMIELAEQGQATTEEIWLV